MHAGGGGRNAGARRGVRAYGGSVALALVLAALAPGIAGGLEPALWPHGQGHDHADPAHHEGLGFGMAQLGHVPLPWPIGELDAHHDAATGKVVVGALTLDPAGFVLVDGTDPAQPRILGWTYSGGYAADLKFSPDGGTLYVLLQGGDALPQACLGARGVAPFPAVPLWMGTCGVQVWDVTDPGQPAFVRFLPTGSMGAHMMDVADLAGQRTLAFATRGALQEVVVAVEQEPQWPWLVGGFDAGLVHDVTLAMDPLDAARPLAFVANLAEGVRVLDLTDPAAPLELAHWEVPEGDPGGYHTVMPFALEGRRIVAAEQENGGRDWVSQVRFLDLTDLDAPRLLGSWGNPDGHTVEEGGLRWSTHNIHLAEGGMLTVAHYHGGVVVLDIGSLQGLAAPRVLGSFVPAGPRTAAWSELPPDGPTVWDAVPVGPVAWVGDMGSGLYAASLPPPAR